MVIEGGRTSVLVRGHVERLFTGEDVRSGQEMFLPNRVVQFGSIFGHGAYLGPDFTADYLRRAAVIVEAISDPGRHVLGRTWPPDAELERDV